MYSKALMALRPLSQGIPALASHAHKYSLSYARSFYKYQLLNMRIHSTYSFMLVPRSYSAYHVTVPIQSLHLANPHRCCHVVYVFVASNHSYLLSCFARYSTSLRKIYALAHDVRSRVFVT